MHKLGCFQLSAAVLAFAALVSVEGSDPPGIMSAVDCRIV
jgi:hypothetical protein